MSSPVRRISRRLAAAGAAAFAYTSLAMLRDGRRRSLVPATTALLFGAAVWDSGPCPELRLRAERAAELYVRGQVTQVICAGGDEAETAAMERLLVEHGVPSGAIRLDPAAASSRRALLRSAPLLRSGPGPVVLVSSPSHMHRLLAEARRQGLPAQPAPAALAPLAWRPRDHRLLRWQVHRHLREVVAVWWYAVPFRVSTIEARTAAQAARASATLAALTRATDTDAAPRLTAPVGGAISSRFGLRRSGQHEGVDFAVAVGVPVRTAAAGTVVLAGELAVYGRLVAVAHAGGFATVYGHLDEILVDSGARVSAGHVIGRVGATGNAFGPHLHFEVRIDGRPVDPLAHLPALAGAGVPPRPSRAFVARRLARRYLSR
jgi:murein DD-endopeptidase MepM/ murein hydrolase activator NlpD